MAAHLEEEAVLLDMASKRYFRLNATGAAIWKGLEEGLDRETLVARLLAEFEVSAADAAAAVDAIVEQFRAKGLVEG